MSAGWPRWRSGSRWPGWQAVRLRSLSSFSVEGYSPPAPTTTTGREKPVSTAVGTGQISRCCHFTQDTGQRQKPLPTSDCHELLPSPAACSTPGPALFLLVSGRDCLHKESDMVPCLEECHPHKIPRWARLPHRLAWRLPLSKPHGVSMGSHSSMMNRASPRSSLLLSFLYVHTANFDQ